MPKTYGWFDRLLFIVSVPVKWVVTRDRHSIKEGLQRKRGDDTRISGLCPVAWPRWQIPKLILHLYSFFIVCPEVLLRSTKRESRPILYRSMNFLHQVIRSVVWGLQLSCLYLGRCPSSNLSKRQPTHVTLDWHFRYTCMTWDTNWSTTFTQLVSVRQS